MNDYIKAEFEFLSNNQKEILVALLTSFNYEGFEEEGDLLKAYIPAIRFDYDELEALAAKHNLSFSVCKVENENWNQLWESNFQPVIFNHSVFKTPWLAIRADFHPTIGFAEHEIIITPKMSFGTGHHTTHQW
jgi:ribosomal protein L11 methyltransferase